MAIKLVVCDIDGTLAEESGEIPIFARRFTPTLRERGVYFALATGRPWRITEDIVEKMQVDSPCILCNGAMIATQEKILYNQSFPALPLKEVLTRAREGDISTFIDLGGREGNMILARTDLTRKYETTAEVHFPEEEEWGSLRLQKITMIGEQSLLDSLYRGMALIPEISIVYYHGAGALEVMPAGCNKAKATAILAGKLGVGLDEVMAIGNDYNDLEMLLESGVGVAVGNARAAVKEAADYVAKGKYAKGVWEAIEQYCLGDSHP